MQNSKDVSVPPAGVKKAALAVKCTDRICRSYNRTETNINRLLKEPTLHSNTGMHPFTEFKNGFVNRIFLVDLLNFSFWSERDPDDKSVPHPARYSVEYEGIKYTGYWALCACINRAIMEGFPILKTQWWAKEATDKELQHVFRSDSEEMMPMINERIRVMREDGDSLLRQATILLILHHIFTVQIFKRAQILIADIWACFDGEGLGHFDDIDKITMFADYRVPQALYHLGCLQFSDRLIDMLKEHRPMASGSVEEVEIRGNSIWSVELLKREIQEMIENDKSNMKVNAILLDFYIWDFAKEIQGQVDIPTHRTRSVYY
ncbi:hypothetical protein NQZ79_g1397 [Umbelopsis isabellina]|nr:hypothetical protein NQZ79_g1397 [Umbelopsis isabellina]